MVNKDKLKERIKKFYNSQAELAKDMCMNPSDFYRKMKTGDFDYDEIVKLSGRLCVAHSDVADYFPEYQREKLIHDILKYQSTIKRPLYDEFYYLTRSDMKKCSCDELNQILDRIFWNIVSFNAEIFGVNVGEDWGCDECSMLMDICDCIAIVIRKYEETEEAKYWCKMSCC